MVWDSRSSLTSADCIIRLGLQEQGARIGGQGSGNAGRLRWTTGGLVWSGEWNFRIAPAVLVFRGPRLWAAVEPARDDRVVLQRGPGPLHGSGVGLERMFLRERRRSIREFAEGENRLHTFPAHRLLRGALRCSLKAAWNGRRCRNLDRAGASSTSGCGGTRILGGKNWRSRTGTRQRRSTSHRLR